MKMVQHPNVVRLYEVIDTATKLYLILELGDGGDMYDCIMKHDGGLSEEVSGAVGSRVVIRLHGHCISLSNVQITCRNVYHLGLLFYSCTCPWTCLPADKTRDTLKSILY